MHELSIAMSMIEMATEEARLRGGAQVLAVHLKIGRLSGVVKDALLFSWEIACEGTILAGSRLVVEESPVVVHCAPCGEDRALPADQWLSCPVCNALTPDVVSGTEIEVVALEIQ
jgi:hydrogenase nickel incorporation protein HypA/HybF